MVTKIARYNTVTLSFSSNNVAWRAAAVRVVTLDVEAVLSVGIQVSDDSAACRHVHHYVSLILDSSRIILLVVNNEATDCNTLLWMILHHKQYSTVSFIKRGLLIMKLDT